MRPRPCCQACGRPLPIGRGPADAEQKMAKRLGTTPAEVRRLCDAVYGRPLVEEREGRLGGTTTARADQARRGHVTRQIVAELQTTLDLEAAKGGHR